MNTQSYKCTKAIAHASLMLGILGVGTMMPLSAQAPQGMGAGMGMGMGPSGDIPKFIELGPKVGDQLPDLTIVDDLGNPVALSEITGDGENYTVLTLGCLT
jgi:hypothetical protein